MASTCTDIITRAMRMNRVLAIGRDPKAAETEEGMAALQSLYDEWRTTGMFGELRDIYLTADATAREGHRYLLAAGVVLTEPTIISPTTCDYGLANDWSDDCSGWDYGWCGVDRPVRDLALYEKVDSAGVQTARLYDRTAWVDLLNLQTTDPAPLSGRSQYGLAACLATSGGFMGAFGAQPAQTTIATAEHFLSNIMGHDGSTANRSRAVYL